MNTPNEDEGAAPDENSRTANVTITMNTPNEEEGAAPDEYSRTANGDADLLDDAGIAGDEVSSSVAAIVNEAASLSALSYTQTRTADTDTGASITDFLEDDVILASMEEELSSATVADKENKPSISMVTAIVDEILRQKESTGEGGDIDIADIASKEVDKLYKDNKIDGMVEEIPRPMRSHPWNEEEGQMSSLFARERENRNTAAMISSTIKSVMGISGDAVTEDDITAASFDRSTNTGEEFDPRLPPDYDDLCSEMGLDPTQPSYLGLSPPRRNRLRYFHPAVLARSPKCQFCAIVFCLVGIATAIALSVTQGIERQKKRDQELHPHWMEEQNANDDKDWWKEGDQFGGDNAEKKGESSNTPSVEQYEDLLDDQLEQLYYTVSDAYLPIWYDRETGWKGQSFKEAMEFCRAHDDFVPCPYEVYCPGGAGNLIFGERFEDEHESWAPILDDWNEWVQVGNGRKQCVTFSGAYKVKPPWGGRTGSLAYVGSKDVEKSTRHIMCCLEQPLGNNEAFVTPEVPTPYVTRDDGLGEADHIPPHENDLPDITEPSLSKISQLTTNDNEVHKKYDPFWFTESGGWKGTTYEDGREFCESMMYGPDIDDHFRLCPIFAHCPNGGEADKPLVYQMEAFDEGMQWSPISNGFNQWVMVGRSSDGPFTCRTHSELYNHEPDWGIDGTQPELKKFILCCQDGNKYDSGNGIQKHLVYESLATGNKTASQSPTEKMPVIQTRPTDPMDEVVYPLTSSEQSIQTKPTDDATDLLSLSDQGALSGAKEEDGTIPPHTNDLPDMTNADEGLGLGLPETPELTTNDKKVHKKYDPFWFSENDGWKGTTYEDGREFCESMIHGPDIDDHFRLCPISAHCPNGKDVDKPLVYQMEAFDEGMQWSPISNGFNQWVMVGRSSDGPFTCRTHMELNYHEPDWGIDGTQPELKKYILCCQGTEEADNGIDMDEVDQSLATGNEAGVPHTGAGNSSPHPGEQHTDESIAALKRAFDPVWFDFVLGWNGGTHDEALEFCDSLDRELCPYGAYCPQGPTYPALPGHGLSNSLGEKSDQWAPIINANNEWVMIGTIDNNKSTQCMDYSMLNGGDSPSWGLDGSMRETKLHILCCDKSTFVSATELEQEQEQYLGSNADESEPQSTTGAGNSSPHPGEHHTDESIAALKRAFDPVWFDFVLGWNGGTHDEALEFCDSLDRELCPYGAYCPQGPTYPAFPGHGLSNSLGEKSDQWAPIINANNEWVMIGTIDNNKSTQCMDYSMLNGGDSPSWGLDGSMRETKLHILCCDKSTFVSATELEQEQEQYLGSNADESEPQSTTFQTSEETVPEEQYLGSDSDSLTNEGTVPDTDSAMQTGTWFNTGDGWNAGSNDDGIHFCALKEKNSKPMVLCPYESYCPSGPSQPPADGISVMGDEEHEQWAPMGGGGGWVIVGMRGHNTAVQCLTHENLYGTDAEVDLPKNKKYHIMCCGG